MVSLCKRFRVLPRPGGLLDQDSLFVHMANVCEAAANERAELDRRKEEAKAAALRGRVPHR